MIGRIDILFGLLNANLCKLEMDIQHILKYRNLHTMAQAVC